VQVYKSWADLWSTERRGHMVRVSMHTHIFVLPIDLPCSVFSDRSAAWADGEQESARSVLLRLYSISVALRDTINTATQTVESCTAYRY
jgi:hypothetical protein